MNSRARRWIAAITQPEHTPYPGAMFAVGATFVTVLAVIQLWPGVSPDSLWLDDQWVAALVRHASPAKLIELMPAVPLGFVILLKAAVACLGWGHWQLQALPIALGIAQVPFIGWIAWRMTNRVSLGLIAATLLGGNRWLMIYSLRVKQYSLECMITLVLIWLALGCVRQPRGRTLALILVAAAIALPFSFTAVPVGLVIVNTLSLHLLLANDDARSVSRKAILGGCAAYNITALAFLCVLQRHQSNDATGSFWNDHFAPIHNPQVIWTFARSHGLRFLTGALPSMFVWLLVGVPLGIVLLSRQRSTRFIGLALLLFYGGMLAISALHVYPLGGRRTDIFSFPITILAVIAAIHGLGRFVSIVPRIVLLVVVVQMLLYYPQPHVDYPLAPGRRTVETIVAHVQDEDGLVLAPFASWAVACYGVWPIELVRSDDSTVGFVAECLRDRTVTMRQPGGATDPQTDSEEIARQLDSLLSTQPPRLFYLSIYSSAQADEWAPRVIESSGYVRRPTPEWDVPLMLFERATMRPDENGPALRP